MYSYHNNDNKFPYSQKIWREIKFGGLVVYITSAKLKIRQNFLLTYIRAAIPYRTAKFKSTNILAIAIWAQMPNLISANISGYTIIIIMNKIIRFLEKSLPV